MKLSIELLILCSLAVSATVSLAHQVLTLDQLGLPVTNLVSCQDLIRYSSSNGSLSGRR